MDTRRSWGQLEERLRACLEHPKALDADVYRFIESSLGVDRAEDLCALFRDNSSSERAVVLDLVLFPPLALQLAIEPLLPDQGFNKAQISGLIKRLGGNGVRFAIQMPNKDCIHVPLELANLAAFVNRLNLDWANDAGIAAALSALGPDRHLFLQVKMRNQRAVFPESGRPFVAGLIAKMGAEQDFEQVLELLVASSGQWPSGLSPHEFLATRRKSLADTLQKSGQIEIYRQRAGFEYALSSGIRMPYIDTREVKRQIELLDRIWIAMFGNGALLQA